MQWNNYNAMCEKDRNGEIFDGSSNGQKVFWGLLIFGTSLLAFLFGLLGFAGEGWETLGLTFYIGFLCVNIWQRMRIRQFFGITCASQGKVKLAIVDQSHIGSGCGSYFIFCDCLSRLCCAYCWTIVQEKTQETSDEAGVVTDGVELVPRSPQKEHVAQQSHDSDKGDENFLD